MKLPFSIIFQEHRDGSITPKVPVRINGVDMGPGVTFGGGVSFGGVNLQQCRDMDVECEDQGGVWVIQGFHPNGIGGISGTISFRSN